MSKKSLKDSLQLNKPRRTPNHPTKSHVVKINDNGTERLIRFGQQGVSTAGKPKKGESKKQKARRKSFKARHAKNIAKGKTSAAYWANKVKWNFVNTDWVTSFFTKLRDQLSVGSKDLKRCL